MAGPPAPEPRIHARAYVHPSAVLIGDVHIGPDASIWPHAVLRGDVGPIRVGEGANIQDGAVIHTDPGSMTDIGARVTVGHRAVVHGAVIGEETLIGMGSIVLERAALGTGCLVAAGAVIREGSTHAAGSLLAGVPAKLIRTDPALRERNRANADRYIGYAERMRAGTFGTRHVGRPSTDP